MRRLLLVQHDPTAQTRGAAFPFDEPLDERGRGAAAVLARGLPGSRRRVLFWRVDAAPLSITELHGDGERWIVNHLNCAL